MTIKQQFLPSLDELRQVFAKRAPFIFLGSRTSTVIPYDKLESLEIDWIVDSSQISPQMELSSEHELKLSGAVNWKEAKAYCQTYGRNIKTSPTEELAQILSGVATSCTGERCFGYGTLRDQIKTLTYMDTAGDQHTLYSDRDLSEHHLFESKEAKDLLKRYQESYKEYRSYKNAPFPRFEKETDLMVGTEGQLGVITDGSFSTAPSHEVVFLFFALPKWERDDSIHLEIYDWVQRYRHQILSCELIDENSWNYLDKEEIPVVGKDTIFLEVIEKDLEEVYEKLTTELNLIKDDAIFSMPVAKFHQLRMKIPRAIFEVNSQMGVIKKGTDVQAIGPKFKELLQLYRNFSNEGIRYNLFGHFGDAHLHFNFMPSKEEADKCDKILGDFYKDIKSLRASPFAEHGIGLIKKKYIKSFLSPVHFEMFQYLKANMDPENLLFPWGYMNMKWKMEEGE
ncbi:MAG: hypothetical protein CME63_14045 [Halobacteriovoraceae bacterium]|nr:hypothetical protein [Halobacteriovoraceae bacterium]